MPSVRVIECGGKGYRLADVTNSEIGEIRRIRNLGIRVDDLIAFALSDLPPDNIAIVFSIAGIVDERGAVALSPNIPMLTGVPLRQLIMRTYAKPVIVKNDMETAVEGMIKLFPHLAGCSLGITWSSGIGLRFVWKGDIVSSSEASHICQDRSGGAQLCGCSLRGCVDALLGGVGISRRIVSELNTRGLMTTPGMNLCVALDAAYVAKEPWALDIYRFIAEEMGAFLATLVSVVQVPAIIWKGSFAQKALRLPGIEEAIRASMGKKVANKAWALKENLKFEFVPLPPNAIEDSEAFLGGYALALKQ